MFGNQPQLSFLGQQTQNQNQQTTQNQPKQLFNLLANSTQASGQQQNQSTNPFASFQNQNLGNKDQNQFQNNQQNQQNQQNNQIVNNENQNPQQQIQGQVQQQQQQIQNQVQQNQEAQIDSSAQPVFNNPQIQLNLLQNQQKAENLNKFKFQQSQQQLDAFLKNCIYQRDEESLTKNKNEILQMLKEVQNNYNLRDINQSYNELQQEIHNLTEAKQFFWSQQMLNCTSIKNFECVQANTIIKNVQFQKYQQESKNERQKISLNIRQNLIFPICENFNLQPTSALKLLNSYFCEQPQKFHQISRIEQQIAQIEQEIIQQEQRMNQLAQQIQNQSQQRNNGFYQIQPDQNIQNSQNPQFQQQLLVFDSLQQKHKAMADKCNEILSEIREELLYFYMQERKYLLKNIGIILQYSSPQIQNISGVLLAFRSNLLREGQLAKKLIDFLHRNLKWDLQEFVNVNQFNRNNLVDDLLVEQIQILQIIFKIAQQQDLRRNVDIDLTHIIHFFEYLKRNDFSGKLIDNQVDGQSQFKQQQNQEQMKPNQIIQTIKIRDIGLLTFLQMLNLETFAENQKEQIGSENANNIIRAWYDKSTNNYQENLSKLNQCIKTTEIDPINSIAIIAVFQVFEEIQLKIEIPQRLIELAENYFNILLQSPFIEQLEAIVRTSPLITDFQECIEDPQIVINQFMKIARSFINLVYVPILLKKELYDQQIIVQKLTLDVFLKNPFILKDMWKQINNLSSLQINKPQLNLQNQQELRGPNFNVIKMYEEYFQNPIQNLQTFSYILNVMSGSNKDEQAKNTYNLLKNTFIKQDDGQIPKNNVINQQEDSNSLLKELIVGWIALISYLEEFNRQQVEIKQEIFDQLMNIIVIFSKIIRQKPSSFDLLNEQIEVIIQQQEFEYSFAIIRYLNINHNTKLNLSYSLSMQFEKTPVEGYNQKLTVLLVNTLFQLMLIDDSNLVVNELKHVMNAISSVFALHQDQRKVIFDLILFNQDLYGFYMSKYFLDQCHEFKKKEHQLKFSLSYLKFITKVFKIQYPQKLLNYKQQTQIHKSILNQMLKLFYKEIVNQFYKIEFQSLSDFCKLAKRILKLTYILLEKFDCGDSAIIKIEIQQPCPYFDPLLNLIFEQIKDINLNLITSILDLQENQGFKYTSNFSKESYKNKYIQTLISNIQKQKSSNIFVQSQLAIHQKTQINDMILQSLKCLNQILRLSLQNEIFLNYLTKQVLPKKQNFKDFRGVKIQYIQQIGFVKQIKQQILQPIKQGPLEIQEQKYNIVSLITYYSKSEVIQQQNDGFQYRSEIFPSNNILALGCLKTICLFYQALGTNVDIVHSILKNSFFQLNDLEHIFLIPLVNNFNVMNEMLKNQKIQNIISIEHQVSEKSKFIIQMLEIFTFCSYSQKTLMSNLFSQPLYANQENNVLELLINEISEFFNQKISGNSSQKIIDICTNIGQKLVGFISVVAQERIALNFLRSLFDIQAFQPLINQGQIKLSNSQLLRKIVDNHIVPVWIKEYLDQHQKIDFNIANEIYQDELEIEKIKNIKQKNLFQIQFIRNYCKSVLSLTQFLKLVQSLYSIDPTNNTCIREIIQEIYCNERFKKFLNFKFCGDLQDQLESIFQKLFHINKCFKQNGIIDGQQQIEFQNLEDFAFKQQLWDNVIRDNILTGDILKLTQNHAYASKPRSTDHQLSSCSVYLSNLDTYQSFHFLNFLQNNIMGLSMQTHLTQNPIKHQFEKYFSPNGGVGSEFLISSEDLKYILKTQGFDSNEWAVDEFVSQAQSFNLAISCLYSLNVLEEAKDLFIMSIGRSKLREIQHISPCLIIQENNQNQQIGQIQSKQDQKSTSNDTLVALTSLFSLVNQYFPENKNGEIEKEQLFHNLKMLIAINFENLKNLFEALKDKNNQRQSVIMISLTKVVSIMQKIPSQQFKNKDAHNRFQNLFQVCIRSIQIAFNLLNEKSIQEIIYGNQNQPLRPIFRRLIDQNQALTENSLHKEGIDETIMIVQFLNTYAKSKNGALNLFQENVFYQLLQNQYIVQSITQNYYSEPNNLKLNSNSFIQQSFKPNQSLVRNPFNILWCHVLLLIRNLNTAFLDDENENSIVEQYLSKLVIMILSNKIDQRISDVLCSVLLNSSYPITHGLLEETELILSIVLQLFMQAQTLQKYSYGLLQSLKDCLIFGTSQLIINMPLGQANAIKPVSSSEDFLTSQEFYFNNLGEFPLDEQFIGTNYLNLFYLKTWLHYIKINQTFSASILELLLQQNELSGSSIYGQDSLFPVNWNYVIEKLGNSHFEEFNKGYICQELGNLLKKQSQFGQTDQIISIAQNLLQNSFDTMKDLQIIFLEKKEHRDIEKVYIKLQETIQNDEMICDEYKFLNLVFVSSYDQDENNKVYKNDFDVVTQILISGCQINEQLNRIFNSQY